MRNIILACLVAGLCVACTKTPDKTVTLQANVPAENQALIKTAIKQLTTSCVGLQQYSYDLTNWRAFMASNGDNPFNFHTEAWGWTKWIEVTVEVRNNARDLPKEWNAPGKVLQYDLGGGRQAGIDARDTLSQLMCATIPVSNDPTNPDTFLSVPQMKVLDDIK
ncbi:MAG TPA: hypothetical protein VFX47_08135 [Gammaproteobacteria bacterium]|nr:hypothetical protein [Gammaproteobacteria bacterium]